MCRCVGDEVGGRGEGMEEREGVRLGRGEREAALAVLKPGSWRKLGMFAPRHLCRQSGVDGDSLTPWPRPPPSAATASLQAAARLHRPLKHSSALVFVLSL